MVYKPAPVIMSWLAYPCTTGCEEVNYVIGDKWLYTSEHSKLFVEKMLVLPESWYFIGDWPYAEPRASLPVNECLQPAKREQCFDALGRRLKPLQPAKREQKGYITFGTLMNPYKISPGVISAWTEILLRVKNAKFILNHYTLKGFSWENLKQSLEAEGFPMDRLIIVSEKHATGNHLHHYYDIDIALDTFPYTGGTTTVDALLMGVPLITLVGDCLHERISYSVIQNSGLEDPRPLIAWTVEEYIEKAVELAENRVLLNDIHDELVKNIRSSNLFSPEKMSRQFEVALIDAWDETFPKSPLSSSAE